jgi:tetratricopeptide (TPR) repeat protein
MAKNKKQKESIAEAHQRKQLQKVAETRNSNIKILRRVLALICGLCGVIIYLNTLHHGFVLDDYSVILENRITKQGVKAIPQIFSSSYRSGYYLGTDELYRPIPKSIFAISWNLFGDNPLPLHLLNIVLYGATGIVLFNFCYLVFPNLIFSFVASMLFVLHPVHTEVVANIKSVDEILSFLLCISACIFLVRYVQTKKIAAIVLTSICYFAALLSKESSITFLAIFPLLILIKSVKKETSFSWSAVIKPILTLVAFALLFLLIRHSVLSKIASGDPSIADNLLMAAKSYDQKFATSILILGMYLKLLFIPHPLVFDYSFNQIPLVGMGNIWFILSMAIHIGLLLWAVLLWKKNKLLSFTILFYFISMSIYANIFYMIGSSFGERFLYTASFGFCMAVAYALSLLSKNQNAETVSSFFKTNLNVFLIFTPVAGAFVYKTITRNTVWKSNYTLYANDVNLSPNSTRTHYYYGNLLGKDDFQNGKTDQEKDSIQKLALSELEKSVAIFPFGDAYNQMGIIYDKRKDFKKSFESYQLAMKAAPNDPMIQNNLGSLYFNMGQIPEAKACYEKAVQLNPSYSEAFMNLGSACGMLKQYDEAVTNYLKAIKFDPNLAQAYYYLGLTYRFKGDQQNSAFYYDKAAKMDPVKYGKK